MTLVSPVSHGLVTKVLTAMLRDGCGLVENYREFCVKLRGTTARLTVYAWMIE